ncbi:MAG: hypothetical protein ACRC5R_01960, partial [Mycoplasmatales bacterium]
ILLISNFIFGIGLTLKSGADESFIFEETKNYEKNFRLYSSASLAAGVIAILIGGVLWSASWKYVFIIAVLIHLLGLLVLISLPKSQNNKNTEHSTY